MAQDGHFDTRDRTFCHNFIAFSLPGALVRALPFLKAFRKRNPDGRPRKDLKPEKF